MFMPMIEVSGLAERHYRTPLCRPLADRERLKRVGTKTAGSGGLMNAMAQTRWRAS
jgi:hypothetical protein